MEDKAIDRVFGTARVVIKATGVVRDCHQSRGLWKWEVYARNDAVSELKEQAKRAIDATVNS